SPSSGPRTPKIARAPRTRSATAITCPTTPSRASRTVIACTILPGLYARPPGRMPPPAGASCAIPEGGMTKPGQQADQSAVRFAGDSGDGMQLTGDRFTTETAALGNDLSTLPDFPAEIRAPAGSLPGVSGFQIHFSDHDILTPGDRPDVLVAMNPAALRTNL